MGFKKFAPSSSLRACVAWLAVSDTAAGEEYPVLPNPGLVMGFQFSGSISRINNGVAAPLNSTGITGITSGATTFRTMPGTGTVLVYFTETGFARFSRMPVHELYNRSQPLDDLFPASSISEVQEKLAAAITDWKRVEVVDRFLVQQLLLRDSDPMVEKAVQLIRDSKGMIRISELQLQLHTSASPLEKRFRHLVGTTPKKFSFIIRMQSVLDHLADAESMTALSYEYDFFDQAHFIKSFRQFTGQTPEDFLLK